MSKEISLQYLWSWPSVVFASSQLDSSGHAASLIVLLFHLYACLQMLGFRIFVPVSCPSYLKNYVIFKELDTWTSIHFIAPKAGARKPNMIFSFIANLN